MMASLPLPTPAASPDDAITANREETKFLLDPEHVGGVLAELERRLVRHRFTGEGANRLPDAHHFVTTVYFDTPSSALYRAATLDGEHNVKIRAKEYYDVHPSLAELATDPGQLVRYQPWLWFELKHRERSRTSKHRFQLRKRDVPRFFTEGRVTPEVIALDAQHGGSDGGAASGLAPVLAFWRTLSEPLCATLLVNYRRLAWQAHDSGLRVTLDLGLSFYEAPADLWTRDRALVRDTLGPVRGRESSLVLEVKRNGALPPWLDAILAGPGVRASTYSKFVAGRAALERHG